MIPLTHFQLIQTVIDEVELCLVDKHLLVKNVEKKEIFNDIYDIELTEIYKNDAVYDDFLQRLLVTNACSSQ